jgi:hypothetical protein
MRAAEVFGAVAARSKPIAPSELRTTIREALAR